MPLLKAPLLAAVIAAITEQYRRLLIAKQKEILVFRRCLEKLGMIPVATDEAAKLVSALYETSFENEGARPQVHGTRLDVIVCV